MEFRGIGQPQKTNAEKLKDFLKAPNNRKKRRAIARVEVTVDPMRANRPHARCSGMKPVKRPEQIAIEFRRQQRAELLKVKLVRLLRDCPDIKFVIGSPGLTNVWKLSQLNDSQVAAIPGLGPVRRKKIHAYLVSENVPVAWAA